MKTKIENFDDIIFENRNKEYGAYELRASYSKRGLIAMVIAMAIFFLAFGIPLIANMMKEVVVLVDVDRPGIGEIFKPDDDKKNVPPIPDPPPPVQMIKFSTPIFVDSITDPGVELDIAESYEGNTNTFIDTTSYQNIEVKETKEELSDTPMEVIDIQEKPMFPGGDIALLKYVAENTKYPTQAINDGSQGTVYIRFVVTKTGQIGEAKVMRPVDPLLEEEALRVVKSFPQWAPGKYNGKAVNVWFIIPVKFKLQY